MGKYEYTWHSIEVLIDSKSILGWKITSESKKNEFLDDIMEDYIIHLLEQLIINN